MFYDIDYKCFAHIQYHVNVDIFMTSQFQGNNNILLFRLNPAFWFFFRWMTVPLHKITPFHINSFSNPFLLIFSLLIFTIIYYIIISIWNRVYQTKSYMQITYLSVSPLFTISVAYPNCSTGDPKKIKGFLMSTL